MQFVVVVKRIGHITSKNKTQMISSTGANCPHALCFPSCTCCSYSAIFVDDDPDVYLGQENNAQTQEAGGVKVTDSGHVRLNERTSRGGSKSSRDGQRKSGADEQGFWAASSSDSDAMEGPKERGISSRKVRGIRNIYHGSVSMEGRRNPGSCERTPGEHMMKSASHLTSRKNPNI